MGLTGTYPATGGEAAHPRPGGQSSPVQGRPRAAPSIPSPLSARPARTPQCLAGRHPRAGRHPGWGGLPADARLALTAVADLRSHCPGASRAAQVHARYMQAHPPKVTHWSRGNRWQSSGHRTSGYDALAINHDLQRHPCRQRDRPCQQRCAWRTRRRVRARRPGLSPWSQCDCPRIPRRRRPAAHASMRTPTRLPYTTASPVAGAGCELPRSGPEGTDSPGAVQQSASWGRGVDPGRHELPLPASARTRRIRPDPQGAELARWRQERRVRRPVRISLTRISGCSRAAKWPPLSASP
jgi:hypothetical protein